MMSLRRSPGTFDLTAIPMETKIDITFKIEINKIGNKQILKSLLTSGRGERADSKMSLNSMMNGEEKGVLKTIELTMQSLATTYSLMNEIRRAVDVGEDAEVVLLSADGKALASGGSHEIHRFSPLFEYLDDGSVLKVNVIVNSN